MKLLESEKDPHQMSDCDPLRVFTRWAVFPNMPDLSEEACKRVLAPYGLSPLNYTDILADGRLLPIVLLSDEPIPEDVLSEPIINAIYVYSGCSEPNKVQPGGKIDFSGTMDLHPSGGVYLRGKLAPEFEKIKQISFMVDINLVDPCLASSATPVFLAMSS